VLVSKLREMLTRVTYKCMLYYRHGHVTESLITWLSQTQDDQASK